MNNTQVKKAEGVVKFTQLFTKAEPLPSQAIIELNHYRQILFNGKLIGQDPSRYGGAGYGNVSQRLPPFDAPPGRRTFFITGTQTGGLEQLSAEQYTIVTAYYPERNEVHVKGPISASSEAMTHASVYDCVPEARFVLHVHAPLLWQKAYALGIPCTDSKVPYGTPEMVQEVQRLFVETSVKEQCIFSMGGHEDGIITFGQTGAGAAETLLRHVRAAEVFRG